MRIRVGVAGGIAVVLAALMLTGQGRADPACEPRPLGLAGIEPAGGFGFLVKRLHHRIAFNRPFAPFVDGEPVNATFSVKAQNPKHQISHPIAISDPQGFSRSAEGQAPTTFFSPGDGTAVATWTWEDSRLPGCARAFSYILRPVPGFKPAFEPKVEQGDARFISGNREHCPFRLAPGPESMRFGDGGGSQTMRLGDDCRYRYEPDELESPDWLAVAHGGSITLTPRFDQPGLHRIPYWARFRGKVFASGIINVVSRGLSSRVTSITRR